MIKEELLKNFGLKVKFIRIKKGISQANLAELLGVNDYYISNIECGKRNITLGTINKIANALDIDVSKLFDFKD